MDRELELDLVGGGRAKVILPEPGDFASIQVLSMECSGQEAFWALFASLMGAAGRPVVAVHEISPLPRRLGEDAVTPSARNALLQRRGYGFGVFFEVDAMDPAAAGPQVVFLRNPRFLAAALHQHLLQSAPNVTAAFRDFLNTPIVEQVVERYHRFVDLRRRNREIILFRYEHALSGWHAIAADLVVRLKLPLTPKMAASIATTAASVGDRLPVAGGLTAAEVAAAHKRFADVSAALGFEQTSRPLSGAEKASPGRARKDNLLCSVVTSRTQLQPLKKNPPPVQVADPVLHSRLRPNSSQEMRILGRTVIQEVDASGHRPVSGQPAVGEITFAVYGCSCTFGVAIPAEETFCSVLQGMLPTWRIENHGTAGYSTTRNLIELERDAYFHRPEVVTFCWIEHHLGRNVASAAWMQNTTRAMPKWTRTPSQRSFPRAALDVEGNLQISSVSIPRFDLVGMDLEECVPDHHYMDMVCFRLFERANSIVTDNGGHFFVTTLQGKLSPSLAEWMARANIPVVDASLDGEEWLCLPDDYHPNTLANRIFAERIRDYVEKLSPARSSVR